MTTQTIDAIIGGAMLALNPAHGAGLMSMALPDAPVELAASAGSFAVNRGERFAVSRGLAVVPVRGVLTPNAYMLEYFFGWTTYHGLAETLGELVASDEVSGIVMEFDSPGGMVLGCQGAAAALAAAAAIKPVHGLVHPMAFSAAYWLASQCTDLRVTPGSDVGSIGVMARSSDPVQVGGDGWQDTTLRSAHARGKVPDLTTEAGRALMQADIDAVELEFHTAVAQGRQIGDVGAVDELRAILSATDDPRDGGGTFNPAQAEAAGLIDGVTDRAAFYLEMAERYAPAQRKPQRAALAQAATAQARTRL